MRSLLDKIDQILVVESDLYQKKLRNKATGKVYEIEKVLAQKWKLNNHTGWLLALLIEINGSHGFIYWQNINCTEPYVRAACERNANAYEWV